MWKKSFAIIVIGSLAVSCSFASSSLINKMFIQNQKMKSPAMLSDSNVKNSKHKFTGTWAGTCSTNGHTDNLEQKIKLIEHSDRLTYVNADGTIEESLSMAFDKVTSESHSDNEWYDFNHRLLARLDENTLKFKSVSVLGNQPPVSTGVDSFFTEVYSFTLRVNGNQLIIEMQGTSFDEGKSQTLESKCTYKRIG